jgi:hypothetical protein
MAVSSIRLPNISNDGICHAILKNNSRCKNLTYQKPNGQYSKWCSVHTLRCSELNKTYKQSCKNYEYLDCQSSDTYSQASTKLYGINNCLRDRFRFENECLHPSKRDEGHRNFVNNLKLRRKKCQDLIEDLEPVQDVKVGKIEITEEDITNQALDEILSSIEIQPKPKTPQQQSSKEMKKSEYKKKITKPPKKVIPQEEFIFPEIAEQKSGGFKFELYKVSESEKEDIKKRILNESSKKYMEKEFRNLTTKEKLSLTQKSKPIIEKEILQTSITKSYQQLRGYYFETVNDFKE